MPFICMKPSHYITPNNGYEPHYFLNSSELFFLNFPYICRQQT